MTKAAALVLRPFPFLSVRSRCCRTFTRPMLRLSMRWINDGYRTEATDSVGLWTVRASGCFYAGF
jgi:hypothetical protein